MLPGRYPLLPSKVVLGVIVLTWAGSFFVAALVNSFYTSKYEPAVVLCIPDLPIGFFLSLFT